MDVPGEMRETGMLTVTVTAVDAGGATPKATTHTCVRGR
jgi:hypothetical protein